MTRKNLRAGFIGVCIAAMGLQLLSGVQVAAKETLPEGFSIRDTEYAVEAWVGDYDTWASYPISTAVNSTVVDLSGQKNNTPYFREHLAALRPVESGNIGNPSKMISQAELRDSSGIKYTYIFYESGLTVTKTMPEQNSNDPKPVSYAVDPTAYSTLLKHLQSEISGKYARPLWLTMMRRNKIAEIKVSAGSASTEYVPTDKHFSDLFSDIQHDWYVLPESVRVVSETAILKNKKATILINFNNGAVYTLQVSDTDLLIRASGMNYSLLYKMHGSVGSSVETLTEWANDSWPAQLSKMLPVTGKPVIYLYPEQKTDVSVKVDFQGKLRYTYPAYQNGWNVTAYPDGKIINKADNREYSYLFWDGDSSVNWDFQKGFLVKGEDTEKFLVEKLSFMGLTPKEYNEFIVYWLPEMKDNPYNLITFAEEQYEALAPMQVSPKPDSILRVHMVYKAVDHPVSIAPQVLHPFERKGFAVVEWGGTRAS